MSRRALGLQVAIALGLTLAPMPSRALTPIAAGPGAYAATYATPVVVWPRDSALQFVNGDIQAHDVASDETRAPGTAPWCPQNGPRCPLFYAELIGLGRSTEVLGLEEIPSGIYVFRCSPHTWMEGTLVVP